MAAGGRHRSPGSEFTLNGTTAISLPVSSTTATAERSSPPPNSSNRGPRARRPVHQAHNVETEVDVWLVDPPQQQQQQERQQPTEAGQPDFSFPVISSSAYSPPPSPPPKDAPALASKSGFYSKSSSIAQARQHKQRNLNWRDKGQEIARLRKKAASNQGLTVQQIAGGAGTLAVLMLVVILWASRQGKSPIVKHMQRREQILAASLAPAAPNIAKQKAVRPHDSFRDELSTDSKYLISPPHGDFAEQTMNLYHLTHLSTILQRIPIAHPVLLPDPDKSTLTTSHPVSTIFDMSRFSAGTSVAVLDWNDLRPHEAAEEGKTEPLGCWIGMLGEEERIERAKKMQMTGLSPSFVPVRLALGQKESGQGDDLKETHAFLSRFDRDSTAKTGLIDQAKHDSSISTTGSTRRHANPENHVFCIDHSLYRPEHPTTKHSTTHLDPRDHTAFFKHGRHLHFAADVHEASGDIVAYLLGHRAPFIAVHISARAKASECRLLNQPDRCQPNLIEYQRAVDRVKHLVAQGAGRKSREHRHSARNLSIVVSTDVKDLAFLGELANLGWTLMDYDDGELRERFGRWDPQVMDQAIESRSAAFVGTRGCPQSTLSALRVRTWRTGPTELI